MDDDVTGRYAFFQSFPVTVEVFDGSLCLGGKVFGQLDPFLFFDSEDGQVLGCLFVGNRKRYSARCSAGPQ